MQSAKDNRKRKFSAPEPVEQRATRSQGEISAEQFQADIALGNEQAQRVGGGGVGIPGGRTAADVRLYRAMSWGGMDAELKKILQTSKHFRANEVPLEAQREQVKDINRQVPFPKKKRSGLHSLHVANDIAAVWNSVVQGKSKVYDYPDLAPKLELRLTEGTRGKKKYFDDSASVENRRAHVAAGMQHLIAGDREAAFNSFKEAGATDRGRKWIYKLSNIMLAEHGREIFGKPKGGAKAPKKKAKSKGNSPVFSALEHIRTGNATFEDVFASKQTPKLAPFAVRGGAKTFKE